MSTNDAELLKLLGFLITAVVLILNIVNFLYARFGENKKVTDQILAITGDVKVLNTEIDNLMTGVRHENLELMRRIVAIEAAASTMAELKPKVDLFWDFVRTEFPKMLLHHGEPSRDELILKLTSNTIKHDEAIDLKAILENEFVHLEDKKSTEALINAFTRLSLEEVLKERRK